MSIDLRRTRFRLVLATPALLLALGAGVSCGGPDRGDDQQAQATVSTRPTNHSTLELARAIARPDRTLARLLAPRAGGFLADGGSLVAHANQRVAGPSGPRKEALHARAGAAASGRVEVTPGELGRLRLGFEPEGASAAQAELVEGQALYRDAYPATDLLVAAAPQRVETLLVLRSAEAPSEFRWRVSVGAGLASFRDEPSGARLYLDARGEPVVRVLAPFALDARGERREASMLWADGELTIALETRGLSYPVLLDPAVESAIWVLVPGAGGVARYAHEMAYDAARKVVVEYGGIDSTTASALGDTQVYDGTSWKVASMTGPSARYGSAMAYDSKRQKTVLFGGSDTQTPSEFYNSETWEWDGASWAKAAPAARPPARYDTSMTYDAQLGAAVLFGGHGGDVTDDPLGDTWTYDGVTWTASAAKAQAATYLHAMTYDPVRDKVTRSGGVASLNGVLFGLGNTQEWSGTGDWATVGSKLLITAGGSEVYDLGNQEAVLFIGSDGPDVVSNTWTWDGTSWTEVLTTGPSPRLRAAMAYDIGRRRAVLQGGVDGMVKNVSSETWEYHLRGLACSDGSACDTGHCVDGVCCETASCGGCQACNLATPGQCSPVMGMQDPDSCTTPNTCDAQGACKLDAGQACKAGAECASSFCVSGVCCGSACGGPCSVCAAALGAPKDGVCGTAHAGLAGTCGGYVCPGESDVCPPNCSSDAGCAPGFYCAVGGVCAPQKAPASACNDAAGADCLSKGCRVCGEGAGRCADGFCCDSPCSEACEVCAVSLGASADGKCTPAPEGSPGAPVCAPYLCPGKTAACAGSCAKDSDCSAGNFCRLSDGTCQKDEALGKPCSAPGQCQAGLSCVDGVCCNSPCNGKCQACAAALKESGKEDGICAFAKGGKNPHKDCLDDGVPSCGHDGTCDGKGACALYPAGTLCKSTGCVGSAQVGFAATGYGCNGQGACLPGVMNPCGLFACSAGTCLSACKTDTDCVASALCQAGVCAAKQPNGKPCKAANACSSGLCVDGVCCDAACQGQCEACDLSGAEGTCVPVGDRPHGARPACAVAPEGSPCAQTHCDGVTRTSCEAFVGPSQACREASCSGGASVLSARCDGKGACPAEQIRLCEPFLCAGAACASAPCQSDADCAAKFRCDPEKHDCLPKEAASCDGDHTVKSPAGTTTDCSPFKCEGTGCKTVCSQIADCASPNVCDASGRCVSPASAPDASSSAGCGCRAAGESPEPAARASVGALSLFLLAALGARRRAPRRTRK